MPAQVAFNRLRVTPWQSSALFKILEALLWIIANAEACITLWEYVWGGARGKPLGVTLLPPGAKNTVVVARFSTVLMRIYHLKMCWAQPRAKGVPRHILYLFNICVCLYTSLVPVIANLCPWYLVPVMCFSLRTRDMLQIQFNSLYFHLVIDTARVEKAPQWGTS